MTTAIELSALGMLNDLQQLEVIGHNLANADTAGFKRDVAVSHAFARMLGAEASALDAQGGATDENDLAVQLLRSTDFSPGALQYTGNPLDIAIEGDGYFEMTGSEGVSYSRRGTFSIDASGRLIAGGGHVVSGEEGDILLRGGEVTVDREGQLYEDGEYAGQLKLVRFADPSTLLKSNGGLLRAPVGMVAEKADDFGLRQGYREASNVKVADEMISMLSVLRHFETSARVIKSYDEMVGTAISSIAEF